MNNLREQLVALLECRAVIIPDYSTAVRLGAILDEHSITYRKAYHTGTFDNPSLYSFRIIDALAEERLRQLCASDVSFSEPDTRVQDQAPAASDRAAAIAAAARAPDRYVQPAPVALARWPEVGFLVGSALAAFLWPHVGVWAVMLPLCGVGAGIGTAVVRTKIKESRRGRLSETR